MATKIPARMRKRPRDARGYPIPWNVLIGKDNTPLFTVNDSEKHMFALMHDLCPLCGETLSRLERWFVGGPQSAFAEQGGYIDLPGHRECEEYALATCPYLSAPRYVHRLDVIDPSKLPDPSGAFVDETQDPNRPVVFVAVASTGTLVTLRNEGLPVVRPTKPIIGIQYWQHGQRLSDETGVELVRGVMGENWRPPFFIGGVR